MSLPPVLSHGAAGIEFFSNASATLSPNTPDPYLNGLPDPVFLLGVDGRVIRANTRALSWLGKPSVSQVEGYHLHEIIQAADWQAAIGSIEGKLLSRFFITGILPRNINLHLGIQGECEFVGYHQESFVLKVSLKKIFSNGQPQLLLMIQDITENKRKELLQNLFVHDLANRVTEIVANSELLSQYSQMDENTPEGLNRWTENIRMISKELALEVSAQQAVGSLEIKKMAAHPSAVRALEEIEKLVEHFYPVEQSHEVKLQVCKSAKDTKFSTDPVLLRRVLTNLVKNAIEASKPGDIIALGCKQVSGQVEFWIQNPAFMAKELQAHLFKPYFSTKNSTRGLGTYSIKFLTEYFLKGTVQVQSSKEEGTCFTVAYPLCLETGLTA